VRNERQIANRSFFSFVVRAGTPHIYQGALARATKQSAIGSHGTLLSHVLLNGFDNPGSGWSCVWKRFAAKAE
jgi:hypothetical protein